MQNAELRCTDHHAKSAMLVRWPLIHLLHAGMVLLLLFMPVLLLLRTNDVVVKPGNGPTAAT